MYTVLKGLFDRKDISRNLPRLLTWAIFAVLLLFEYVNYVTTYGSMAALFGGAAWAGIFSTAVVLMDILALARVFTPETNGDKEPMQVKVLLGVWVIVTVFDTFLTWYFCQVEMEAAQVVAPKVIGTATSFMSVIVSIMVWAIGAMLLYLFGLMLDNLLHGTFSRTSQPKTNQRRSYPPLTKPVSARPPRSTEPEYIDEDDTWKRKSGVPIQVPLKGF